MAQKKAYEVDAWLARPNPDIPIILLYGPDRGLVSERGRALANKSGLPLDDPFSVVRLDGAEIERGRLLDEARTVPMFSPKRLLWLRNASGDKTLAEEVKELCASPPRDALVIIEAGDLKKGAALRSTVEAAPSAMALPCYADEGKDIDAVIDDVLGKSSLTITMEARQALRKNLGGDRIATRGEVEKLALYAMNAGQIGLDDVYAMTGDVAASSADDAVDAALDGRMADLDRLVSRQIQAGGQPFLLLAAALRRFHALQLMRGDVEHRNRSAADAVAAFRPPVFFSRRKSFERAVERWNSAAIGRVLVRLQDTVLQTRRRPDLAEALTRQALLAIAAEAVRRAAGNRRAG